jgi:neurotransmitter:Na+ symporter, NSS family
LMVNRGGTVDAILEEIRAKGPSSSSDQELTTQAYSTFFVRFVGAEGDGRALSPDNLKWLGVLVATFVLNFYLIYRGVSKGIETLCKIAMPLMLLLAIIVLLRVLTLGTPDPTKPGQSVINGLGFMWNPHSEELWDPETWLAASGQIFFSLSVGFGIIINYASYLRDDDDVVLSGLTSCSVNELFEVCFGGLITITAAFIFLGVAAGSMGTFDLGFKALPNVFALMPGGRVVGFLWFFMLFLAAITSSVSMLQPVIAFLEEGFNLKRHASVTLLGALAALGCGFVTYFSEGLTALDTFDFWVGSVLIFLLALVQSVLYGWVFGIDRGEAEAHRGAHLRIPRFVQWNLKFVVPIYLLVIFLGFCWQKLPSSDTPSFTTSARSEADLGTGVVGDALRSEFARKGLSLPGKPRVLPDSRERDAQAWQIRDEKNRLAFRVRQSPDGLEVLAHSPGYVEIIGNNPVALMSMIFVAIVLAFLLVLAHIAGLRWERQGRFDKLGGPSTPEIAR